jgi:hypothetical protein
VVILRFGRIALVKALPATSLVGEVTVTNGVCLSARRTKQTLRNIRIEELSVATKANNCF